MKAAVLREPNGKLVIEDLSLDPPRAGEVRVRIEAAGVCHSDYHYMRGDLQHPLPAVLGHEGAGIVEEVGEGVHSVAAGDHVVLLWRTSCGRCEFCARGRPALCAVGAAARLSGWLMDGSTRLHAKGEDVHHFLNVSCFAEQAVCPEQAVLKIPDDVPLPIAALAGCSVMTGVGAVVNTARVEPGSSVLVIGAGGVGLCAVMGAVLAGAAPIIAADLAPSKLELATSFGATHVINAGEEDVVKTVRGITGEGADYSFEVIGNPETMTQAVRALRRGGVATLVGIAQTGTTFAVNALDLVTQEKSIRGSFYGSTRPPADFPRLFELYRRGRLPLDRLLTRSYPLDRVNEAYEAMLKGEVARSVLLPGG